jgi:hypothetical protein
MEKSKDEAWMKVRFVENAGDARGLFVELCPSDALISVSVSVSCVSKIRSNKRTPQRLLHAHNRRFILVVLPSDKTF